MKLQRLAVEEGPAIGAALLAAVAAAVRIAGEPEAPEPDWAERYHVLHRRFVALYPALAQAGAW